MLPHTNGGTKERSDSPKYEDYLEMPLGQQALTELVWLLDYIQLFGVRSALEIGCCEGRTSAMLARAMGEGSKLRLIDIYKHEELEQNVNSAISFGCDVKVAIGDSKNLKTIKWAKDNGRFDLIFIDGCHQYPDVKADFENYKDLTELIAFHDINNPNLGVRQLWRELLDERGWCSTSIAFCGWYMGIGLLRRAELVTYKRTDIGPSNHK